MTHNQLEDNNVIDYLVIGAGPAGIAAARTLHDAGKEVAIFEQQSAIGGLCGSFQVAGCSFDKFVHLSFAPDQLRNTMFNSTPLIEHNPVAGNFYNGKWLKHPAINNLAPLSVMQKAKIFRSFAKRPPANNTTNYYEWTTQIYGQYFADEFVENYTRKYWGISGKNLNTSWVGARFQIPTADDILHGMWEKNTKSTFYTGMMYYPSRSADGRSGYVQILDKPSKGLKIFFNHKCVQIDPTLQTCTFNNGYTVKYNHLISTMPLPYMAYVLTTCLAPYKQSLIKKFKHTTGHLVSMVFNDPQITDKLWFYVYDRDITAARFSSPSLCCPESVAQPGKMSTLQAEIYQARRGVAMSNPISPADKQQYVDNTIASLKRLGINKDKLLAVNIRSEPYANIISDDESQSARSEVFKMLSYYGIKTCGRFGQWDYLWSHQAYENGVGTAKQLLS